MDTDANTQILTVNPGKTVGTDSIHHAPSNWDSFPEQVDLRPRQVGRGFQQGNGMDTLGEEQAGSSDLHRVFRALRFPQGPAGESKPF